MDIGNQQRVIIVELDRAIAETPVPRAPTEGSFEDRETTVTWPLPLDLDQDVDRVS